jgi:hypothetical protein
MAAKPLTDSEAREIIFQRLLSKRIFIVVKARRTGSNYVLNKELERLRKLGKNILTIK